MPFLLLLLAASLLPAQPVDAEASAQARKQLSSAVSQKDPRARVQALERFLAQKELPPNWAEIGRKELVRAVARHQPAQTLKRANRLARRLPPAQQADLYLTAASALLDTNKFPKPALDAARRAAAFPEAAPRHLYHETLGLALRANQRDEDARTELEAALAANPSAFRAANNLADLAEAAGRTADLLPLRAHAFLARPSPESWTRLTAAYGDRPGLEDYLDERYFALFPAALHPESFAGPAQRTVLAELYTGAGCPPCAAADLAFDAALERYTRRDVAVVIYHVHVPRPDPMTNDDTRERWSWQKGQGVPTYAIDGDVFLGGGNREHAADRYNELQTRLDAAILKAPAARIDLAAAHQGPSVAVRAAVHNLPDDRAGLTLHLVLVEKLLRYSGENSIRFHPMVARRIASFPLDQPLPDQHHFHLAEVEAALQQHLDNFEKHDERHNPNGEFRFRARLDRINPANLAVVAFVQNGDSREVLQSAFADAASPERTSR
jgi:hypothetical protein